MLLTKSHHNVGGLPKKMNLKLIEPLKEFFKDEVRSLGSSLGLVKNICLRHPFPGPGLAIRIIGNITKKKKLKFYKKLITFILTKLNKIIFMIKFGKLMQLYCLLRQLA